MKWTRIEDGYESGNARIFDNGGGVGPSAGSGRWALEIDGRWIANIDTLAEAKQRAEDHRPGLGLPSRSEYSAQAASLFARIR